jgi:hypothetical protein
MPRRMAGTGARGWPRRYTRRGLLPVAAAAAGAAGLAGCGGLRPAQPTGPAATAAPAAVAVWYNGSPPATAVPAYEKMAGGA